MEKQETVADIIAAMRDEGHTGESSCLEWVGAKMRYYADRLEAAWKREAITPKSNPDWKNICAKCNDGDIEPHYCEYYGEPNGCNSPIYGEHPTAKKSLVVGDCAKLREALKTVKRYLDGYTVNILELRRKVDAALAKPPRNCDVGTAEEQFERWYAFCDRYDKDCTGCPCKSPYTTAYCFARWAQMPYEEGGVS